MEPVYSRRSNLLALAAFWFNIADQVDYFIRRAVLSRLVPALYPVSHRSGVETSPSAVSFDPQAAFASAQR